jgi:hypothetical protein
MNVHRTILSLLLAHALLAGCGRVTGYEEEYDQAVLAYIEYFSVPDSSGHDSILVSLRGTIGESTAFRFDRINVARTDSLFRIGVWGRETYKSTVVYPPVHVGIDTVLVLSTPLRGIHYIDIVAAQGVLRDSTTVY